MSDPRFLICLPYTLAMECPHPNDWSNPANFSNDAHDPGGATMDGIIQSEYSIYRKSHGLPVRGVFYISQDEGYDIYEHSYWLPDSPELPPGLDLSYFDVAVNCGPYRANRMIQGVLQVPVDGLWGPITDKAAKEVTDVRAAIQSFTAARGAFYRGLSGFQYFGNGWMHRTLAISQDLMSMTGAMAAGTRMQRAFVRSVRVM